MSDTIKISINPPPSDMRCECCGRHAKECKPFGKAGDPLVGDFDGVLLLKNFRSMGLPNDWYIEKSKEFKEMEFNELKFIEKYGNKAMESYWFIEQLINTVEKSYECRDCFILSEQEFHKIRSEMWSKRAEEVKNEKKKTT